MITISGPIYNFISHFESMVYRQGFHDTKFKIIKFPHVGARLSDITTLTMSLRGFRMPQTFSADTFTPSSSLASLNAVATTSLSDGSLFPPAKLKMTGNENRCRTLLNTYFIV